MGLFDELIDARGRRWQTKDGLSEMQVYHPGDLFPAERAVSWVGLVGDDEEGGVVRAVGLVFDGVWTGIVGDPSGTGFDEVVTASRALVLLLKTRLQEVAAERDRAVIVIDALRAWQSFTPGEKPQWCGFVSVNPCMGAGERVPEAAEAIVNVLAWYDGTDEKGEEASRDD